MLVLRWDLYLPGVLTLPDLAARGERTTATSIPSFLSPDPTPGAGYSSLTPLSDVTALFPLIQPLLHRILSDIPERGQLIPQYPGLSQV